VKREDFLALPTAEVAGLVREAGPKLCVFPINGTRRWFMLEHEPGDQDPVALYLDVAWRRHVELYRLLFDHGVETLVTPVFGPDLLDRGEEYMKMAAAGLSGPASHSIFSDFYDAYEVRVRFYGDYERFFAPTPYRRLCDLFDQITEHTATHDRFRLFFGVCAQDATETIAELAVHYHARHGRVPDKRTLIELYYGETLPPVDLFIGFDKFSAFDMPLIATGDEDLYFTVSPSPYLDERQLRAILYDHLYARRGPEPDYLAMQPEEWDLMRAFYRLNRGCTLGVGRRQEKGSFWYPLPQVELPEGFG
jgi:tuberculosinol/isotuberculosinol synthase